MKYASKTQLSCWGYGKMKEVETVLKSFEEDTLPDSICVDT